MRSLGVGCNRHGHAVAVTTRWNTCACPPLVRGVGLDRGKAFSHAHQKSWRSSPTKGLAGFVTSPLYTCSHAARAWEAVYAMPAVAHSVHGRPL